MFIIYIFNVQLYTNYVLIFLYINNKYYLLDTDDKQQDSLDVYLNVTSRKLHLVFEMRPGVVTSSLVSEIFRAIEGKNMLVITYILIRYINIFFNHYSISKN